MTMCIIGVMRNFTLLLGTKYSKLNHWSILVGFLTLSITSYALLTDWTQPSIVEALPVIGAITGTIAVFFLDIKYTKIGLIVTSGLWLAYELHNGLYGQMVGESLTLLGNIIALTVIIIGRNKGIADNDIETVEEQIGKAITTSIPVITGRIQQIHSTVTKTIPVIKNI